MRRLYFDIIFQKKRDFFSAVITNERVRRQKELFVKQTKFLTTRTEAQLNLTWRNSTAPYSTDHDVLYEIAFHLALASWGCRLHRKITPGNLELLQEITRSIKLFLRSYFPFSLCIFYHLRASSPSILLVSERYTLTNETLLILVAIYKISLHPTLIWLAHI